MPDPAKPGFIDLRPLQEASGSLLGYFVHTWYTQYLSVIAASLKQLLDNGLIENLTRPTERGRYVLFDFGALNLEKLAYILGIYVYILSCHKAANYRLMQRYDGRQVLYLRGYDYEGSVSTDSGMAAGFSTWDTMEFGYGLFDLLERDARIVKVLSPKDVYWETVDAQHYFGGDYDGMIQLTLQRPCSIYLNARAWRQGVLDLLDRMDHYLVYVSSITESVLWELEQLDTDDRRRRVTVVFDEEAIDKKEAQLALQDAMQAEFGERLIWSKKDPRPALTVTELRAQLSRSFLVTTPAEFVSQIDRHRRRIAESSSLLGPGARETWIDFHFHPALDADGLAELRGFSADLQGRIDAAIRDGIECLPLFLDQVQLRIYTTLLMGEHDQTGRALAAYAGVMRGALDYYEPPGEKVGGLSVENRESHLVMLREHLDLADYAGVRLLAYGRSHQFDDVSATASAASTAIFEATTTVVARFFQGGEGPHPG
jgi:hypothetical protein